MNKHKLNITKPIVSIQEICHMIGLSRSRFYQLLNSGFFPKPLYDERSNRPYFDAALQKQILESRNSGIGADGSYMLFYSPRKKVKTTKSKSSTKKIQFIKNLLEHWNQWDWIVTKKMFLLPSLNSILMEQMVSIRGLSFANYTAF